MSEFLKKSLEADTKIFSETDKAKEAKARMYQEIMLKTLPEETPLPNYEASLLRVEELANTAPTKGKLIPFPRQAAALVAAAALFAFLVLGRVGGNSVPMPESIFNPPLKVSDVPGPLQQIATPYRTIATNNSFYLGYVATDYRVGRLVLLIHSRNGDIDWPSLKATDMDGETIKPLRVDEENFSVILPVAEQDIQFSIKDTKGNEISCILPKDI